MAKLRVNLIEVNINKIQPNGWNPNKQSEFIFEKEKRSMEDHGFIDPILVRELEKGFEIIDGEHRWKAAKELGFTTILCNNLGEVEDGVAKKLTIIMNETKGKAEEDKLKLIMASLEEEFGLDHLIATMPYQEKDLMKMLEQDAESSEELGEKLAADDSEPETVAYKDPGVETFTVNLTAEVHELFVAQLYKINQAFYPDKSPEDVGFADPIKRLATWLGDRDGQKIAQIFCNQDGDEKKVIKKHAKP